MDGESPVLKFSDHATEMMAKRAITIAWIEQAVSEPELRLSDPNDPEIELFYRRIPENGNRVLRVAINTCGKPWQVVTTFFDRGMRGKL
ncbi:MAG: DUF4258 domain-containing protein [Gemmatimonadota bacterium]|nr:DUF4258 domain-containing protein [Gemmatimonadota bacterium]